MMLEEVIEVQLRAGNRLDQCAAKFGHVEFYPKYKLASGGYLGIDGFGWASMWAPDVGDWQPLAPHKVKRAQYLIDGLQHRPFISSTLFKDEHDVRLFYPEATTVERLTESEREFDE